MSTDPTPLNLLIGEWFFRDIVDHKGKIPAPEAGCVYMKILMDVAAGDGVLSDEERQWVVGFAAVCGNPEAVVNELKAYQPGTSQDTDKFFKDKDLPYVKMCRMGLIYYGFRAAAADGELHAKEFAAIRTVANKLGLTDEQVNQVHSLYEEEKALRQKRASILFPGGFDHVLSEFDKRNS